PTLRSRDDVAIGRYGVPAVHCLVPNLTRPFASHRVFRRAIEFGIDRTLILEKQLLRGQKIAGCDLVSGPFTSGSGYDDPLRYAELTVAEPLVDARRLLSSAGLVGGANPYINLALDQLDAASGWREARDKLQQIHQLAHDDLTIIPLWQLVDHLAYHKSVQGL